MVVPCGAAAAAAQAAGAGATALGLSMGKTDLDLTRDLFKMQMQQTKRLWTADFAENSVRHGEACMQSAQQHSESQAMATATYFQAEKIASQGFKLARDQDARAYEMSWRAEVRESLRDELGNQNNRFNIIMLCDTVCLSCVFSLVAESSVPESSDRMMVNIYVLFLGLSVALFSISLWCSVIVVRRLYEHTAATLERKLFAQSEDLQKEWNRQLSENLPTGPNEMALVTKAYETWVGTHIDPLGKASIHMMSMGVVAMFITAGVLTHLRYLIEFNAMSPVIIFWSTVGITSFAVVVMKLSEDRQEKRKIGVYDVSWQDHSQEKGPFAKIIRAADQLFSRNAAELGSAERMELFGKREKQERDYCAKTKSLIGRVDSLRKESNQRARTRKKLLQLLTTAAEELDVLPEELTSGLNQILHTVDEADARTADLVTMQSENMLAVEATPSNWARLRRAVVRKQMPSHPIDAQRIPVSLSSLRKKLGEIPITTLLRVKNLSDEPLRLKSGVQLKEGKYIKSLTCPDPSGQNVCHYLYPGTEIPARTEVAICSRSGGAWVPTSGILGKIVYVNRDESWAFHIVISNELIRGVRKCQVQATHRGVRMDSFEDFAENSYWTISRDELDRKANNEFVVSIDVLRGQAATKAESERRQARTTLKSGFLLKNKAFGLRLQWYRKWFELTPTSIVWAPDAKSKDKKTISIKNITSVREANDMVHKHVFEIHTSDGVEPYRLSAASSRDCRDWIEKITSVTGIPVTAVMKGNPSTESSDTSHCEDGVECVHDDIGTNIYPV